MDSDKTGAFVDPTTVSKISNVPQDQITQALDSRRVESKSRLTFLNKHQMTSRRQRLIGERQKQRIV